MGTDGHFFLHPIPGGEARLNVRPSPFPSPFPVHECRRGGDESPRHLDGALTLVLQTHKT
jgi:hypothetical protein